MNTRRFASWSREPKQAVCIEFGLSKLRTRFTGPSPSGHLKQSRLLLFLAKNYGETLGRNNHEPNRERTVGRSALNGGVGGIALAGGARSRLDHCSIYHDHACAINLTEHNG